MAMNMKRMSLIPNTGTELTLDLRRSSGLQAQSVNRGCIHRNWHEQRECFKPPAVMPAAIHASDKIVAASVPSDALGLATSGCPETNYSGLMPPTLGWLICVSQP